MKELQKLQEIMDFKDFKIMLEKKKNTQYSAGCVMGYFENDFNNPKIKEADIYNNDADEYGLETETHVTLLYGLDDKKTDEDELVRLFTMIDGPVCNTTKISLFENELFDVVKWDIEQPELVVLNRMLTSMYPYKTDHPDYHAHVTIAYCLPGEGKKYVKEFKTAKKQKIAYWVYSQADGRKIKITPGKGMTVIREKYPMNERFMTEDELNTFSKQPATCTMKFPDEATKDLNIDKSFEYEGYTVNMVPSEKFKGSYKCTIYLGNEYKAGLRGPTAYDKAKEFAISFIDNEITDK